jgi:hypothetical protein
MSHRAGVTPSGTGFGFLFDNNETLVVLENIAFDNFINYREINSVRATPPIPIVDLITTSTENFYDETELLCAFGNISAKQGMGEQP